MAFSQSSNVISIDVYLHWRALCECRTNALAVLLSIGLLLGTKSSLGKRLNYSFWFDVCFGKGSLKALQLSIESKNIVGLLELVQDYDLVIFLRSTTQIWWQFILRRLLRSKLPAIWESDVVCLVSFCWPSIGILKPFWRDLNWLLLFSGDRWKIELLLTLLLRNWNRACRLPFILDQSQFTRDLFLAVECIFCNNFTRAWTMLTAQDLPRRCRRRMLDFKLRLRWRVQCAGHSTLTGCRWDSCLD